MFRNPIGGYVWAHTLIEIPRWLEGAPNECPRLYRWGRRLGLIWLTCACCDRACYGECRG